MVVAAGFFLNPALTHAQRNLALYSLPGLQQATYANPSFIPESSLVIGLPVLSNVNASFGNNGFSLRDVGITGWKFQGARLDYDKLLSVVENDNIAAGGLNASLLTVGFRLKNHYIAFESSEHVVGNFYYPMDAIQFGADINNGGYEPGKSYNLSGLAYDLTHYRNFSLTYAREFGRASAGVRLRYLIGLENYTSAGPGVIVTATDDASIYGLQGQLELWAAGVQSLSGQGSYPIWGQGNYGFAFDFGSTYSLGDKLSASFSVVNLGGINWSSSVQRRVLGNKLENPETAIDEIFDRFIDNKSPTPLPYNTALPTYFYLGSTYQPNNRNAFSLLLNSRYAQGRHSPALALSYALELSSNFRATLTYSATNGSILNVGGGIIAKAGPLQLFVVSDNLLSAIDPSTFHNAHINMGVNLAFKELSKKAAVPVDTAVAVIPMDSAAIAASGQVEPGLREEVSPIAEPGQSRPQQPVTQPSTQPQTKPRETVTQPSAPPQNQPRETVARPSAPPQTKSQETVAQPSAPAQTKPRETEAKPAAPPQTKPRETIAQPSVLAQTQPRETEAKPSVSPQTKPRETIAQPSAPAQTQPRETVVRLSDLGPISNSSEKETSPAGASSAGKYTIFQGAIRLAGQSEKVKHFYFDIYKVHPGGRRELMRTGRMPGGEYKLYLERGFDHEVNLRNSDSGPLVIKVDKDDLERAGAYITRDITLQKATAAVPEETPARQEPAAEETRPPVEDLMELSVPELQQEEAAGLQRPVPKEEPGGLWVDQPARTLQLKQDISIFKDMDVNSRILARLSVGMEIEVLERTTADWWMVAYRSKIGWVEARRLK